MLQIYSDQKNEKKEVKFDIKFTAFGYAGECWEVGLADEGISGPTRQPSSMKTMSDMVGLSSGSEQANFHASKNFSHSDDFGSSSSKPDSKSSVI